MFFTEKKLHEIFLDLLEKVSFFTGRFIHSRTFSLPQNLCRNIFNYYKVI